MFSAGGTLLGGSCGVTWNAPLHSDGPVSEYLVRVGDGGGGAAGALACAVPVFASPLSCLLANLTVGTPVSFVVLSSNANANVSAPPVLCTPQASEPGVPFLPEGAIAAGNAALTVSWLAPAWTGGRGAPLGSYAVWAYNATCNPCSATLTVPNTTHAARLTGLVNGVPYTVRVQSSNAVGTAVATSSYTVAPMWTPAPVNGVGAVECDSCIRLIWAWAPADANGAPMVCFSVQQCAGAGGCVVYNTTSADTLVWESGPRPVGATYTLRVAGVNALGRGPWSSPPLRVTVAAAPVVIVTGLPHVTLSTGLYALGGTAVLYAALYALNWKKGGDVAPKRDFTALASPLEALWHVATDALFAYAVHAGGGPRGAAYLPPFISTVAAAWTLNAWRVFVFKAALRAAPAPARARPQQHQQQQQAVAAPDTAAGERRVALTAAAAPTSPSPTAGDDSPQLLSGAGWLLKNGKAAVAINLLSCLSLSCLKLYTCRAFGGPGGPLSAPVPPPVALAASTAALWVKVLKGGAQLGIALGAGWGDLLQLAIALKLASSGGALAFSVFELRTRQGAAAAAAEDEARAVLLPTLQQPSSPPPQQQQQQRGRGKPARDVGGGGGGDVGDVLRAPLLAHEVQPVPVRPRAAAARAASNGALRGDTIVASPLPPPPPTAAPATVARQASRALRVDEGALRRESDTGRAARRRATSGARARLRRMRCRARMARWVGVVARAWLECDRWEHVCVCVFVRVWVLVRTRVFAR
jgi:hypothetical protein